MAVNDFPIIDGIAPSFADVAVKTSGTNLALLTVDDIQAVNTGTSLEVGVQRGASGGRKMKRTTGSADAEASLTLYYNGYQKLLRNLMAAAPRRGNQARISLVHFQVDVQFTPPGDIEIYEFRIKGCRVAGRTINAAEGTDAQLVELPLNTIDIADIIDGVEVVLL